MSSHTGCEQREVHIPAIGTYCLRGRGLVVGDGPGSAADPPPERFPGIALTAWSITEGQVSGVDVSGMVVVSVGDRGPAPARQLLLLDDHADPEQLRWLLDVFQGRLGGPLGYLAAWAKDDLGFHQLPVECCLGDCRQTIFIPPRVTAVLTTVAPGKGPGKGEEASLMQPYVWGGRSSWMPESLSRAAVGSVCWPEHGLERDLRGCTGVCGQFQLEA